MSANARLVHQRAIIQTMTRAQKTGPEVPTAHTIGPGFAPPPHSSAIGRDDMVTMGLVGVILLASGTMADITSAVRADLTPTGTLRAAINYGNFIFATKDKATGESRGVAVR